MLVDDCMSEPDIGRSMGKIGDEAAADGMPEALTLIGGSGGKG
jgi:hypothetical protein